MRPMIWGSPFSKWRRFRRRLFYREVPVRVGMVGTTVWVPRLRRYEAAEYVYSGQIKEAGGEWESFAVNAVQERDSKGRLVGLSHVGPRPSSSEPSEPFWIDDPSIVRTELET